LPVTPFPVQLYSTFTFFLVLNDPAVAVTVTGSPAKMAGGVALHANVTGGAFLHPIGKRAIHVEAKTKPTHLRVRESMLLSSAFKLTVPKEAAPFQPPTTPQFQTSFSGPTAGIVTLCSRKGIPTDHLSGRQKVHFRDVRHEAE
jgi:hypothetical protein